MAPRPVQKPQLFTGTLMEVEIYQTNRLIKIWRQVVPLHRRLMRACATPFWTGVATLPGAILLLITEQWWMLAILCMGISAWLVFTAVLSWRRVYPGENDPEVQDEKQRFFIRLTPDYLETRGFWGVSRRSWSSVQRIVRGADGTALFFDEQNWRCVPDWAFASRAEADQFYAVANQYFIEAATREPPDLSKYADEFFRDWGVGAGLSVDYQNQPIDWALTEVYGNQPPIAFFRSSNRRYAIAWFVFAGVLCVYAIQDQDVPFSWEDLDYYRYASAILIAGTAIVWGMHLLLPSLRCQLAEQQVSSAKLAPQIVTIYDDALLTQSSHYLIATRWEALPYGNFDADAYRIYDFSGRLQTVIPIDAFASLEEATQYGERLVAAMDAAYLQGGLAAAPRDSQNGQSTDTNPFESPQS